MKKVLTLSISAVVLAAGLAGCSSNSSTGDKKETAQPTANQKANVDDGKEKMDISMLVSTAAGGGWPENHPMIQKLNEKLNINLKFQWVPGDNYEEKLNVMAASNTFPDVFHATNPNSYNKWQEKGVFLDLKPLLSQYANLTKEIPQRDLQMMNPKDHIYGLPLYAPSFRSNLSIRKDWLDKLNLKMPTTVDEFYDVAKAFAEKDPDGNGKKDTIGFSMNISANGTINNIDYLKGAFGISNNWKLVDGKLVPMQTQAKEWKDFATFLRKAYAEGVLDKDFPVNKERDPWNKLEANTNGIAEVNPNEVYTTSLPTLQKLDPKAEIVQLTPPKGPTGLQFANTVISTAKIVVNAKTDPKKQQRIMKLLDYMLSDEGYTLIKNGIEGVDYKKEGDKVTMLPAFTTNRPQILSTWFFRRFDPGIQIRLWDDKSYGDKVLAWFKNTEPYRYDNPGAGLVSDTLTKVGTDLNKKFTNAIIKVIVGQEPVDSIDKAVEQWKSGGGDDIEKEINDIYAKMK
ncbi:extracellular solute-binding protein [Paenibacillus alba]|uniref:extracellular solute-binding protein n=1 Tax=Paenibacillus alba TaxID=1197127 RepID=UPI0015674323|nr:extracellular solute-binding protein [Paenibacillus alba]NQX67002.1 extracellular solute-binding protein [Paenibacillus alba]